MIFQDRHQAGKLLAEELGEYRGKNDTVVMGLARGGVVVAFEVAKELKLPLDVIVVRKVGAPDNEELALGAVADEGNGVFNENLIALLGVSNAYLRKEVERQREIVKERKKRYLQGRVAINPSGKTVILVDDGIATGASMKVAIQSIKSQQAAKIVLAVPVAPPESLEEISNSVDEVVCLYSPSIFHAVGAFYKQFEQTTDEELIALLRLL